MKIHKGNWGPVTLLGNEGDNVLFGSNAGTLDGRGGNDVLQDFNVEPYRNTWSGQFDPYLTPINRDHRLLGGAGNDSLLSLGGNDLLDGGAGNDQLSASSAGSRTVVFGGGYGIDSLTFGTPGVTGSHTLSWTATTDFSTLRSQRVGNDLRLTLGGGTDRLDLINYYGSVIAQRPEFNPGWLEIASASAARPSTPFWQSARPGVGVGRRGFSGNSGGGRHDQRKCRQ